MLFFNPNSKISQFLSLLVDLVMLQILVLLCSLPVFTIGASFTAMFTVLRKVHEDPLVGVLRSFFTAFAHNFKQSTAIWLVALLMIAVVFADVQFALSGDALFNSILLVFAGIVALILYLTVLYVFPLIAWFENRTWLQIRNAFRIACGHIFTTFVVTLIYVGAFLLCLRVPLLLAFFSISGSAYLANILFSKVFESFIPKDPEVAESE